MARKLIIGVHLGSSEKFGAKRVIGSAFLSSQVGAVCRCNPITRLQLFSRVIEGMVALLRHFGHGLVCKVSEKYSEKSQWRQMGCV